MTTRLIAALLLAASVATPAVAAGDAPRNDPRSAAAGRAIGGAVAPYARIALVYDFEYGVIRSKGVSSMRRVATGHFCIRPSSLTSTDVGRAVPTVTPDYSGSSGTTLLAYARTGSTACTRSEFAVQTVRGVNGSFGASNYVGFTFVVN